jgi:hypothetical protein
MRLDAEATTSGGDGNKFSARLLKVIGEFEELRRDADGLQAYAKLCENQTALKQDVEKKMEFEKKDEELYDLVKQKDEEIVTLRNTISKSEEFQQR